MFFPSVIMQSDGMLLALWSGVPAVGAYGQQGVLKEDAPVEAQGRTQRVTDVRSVSEFLGAQIGDGEPVQSCRW